MNNPYIITFNGDTSNESKVDNVDDHVIRITFMLRALGAPGGTYDICVARNRDPFHATWGVPGTHYSIRTWPGRENQSHKHLNEIPYRQNPNFHFYTLTEISRGTENVILSNVGHFNFFAQQLQYQPPQQQLQYQPPQQQLQYQPPQQQLQYQPQQQQLQYQPPQQHLQYQPQQQQLQYQPPQQQLQYQPPQQQLQYQPPQQHQHQPQQQPPQQHQHQPPQQQLQYQPHQPPQPQQHDQLNPNAPAFVPRSYNNLEDPDFFINPKASEFAPLPNDERNQDGYRLYNNQSEKIVCSDEKDYANPPGVLLVELVLPIPSIKDVTDKEINLKIKEDKIKVGTHFAFFSSHLSDLQIKHATRKFGETLILDTTPNTLVYTSGLLTCVAALVKIWKNEVLKGVIGWHNSHTDNAQCYKELKSEDKKTAQTKCIEEKKKDIQILLDSIDHDNVEIVVYAPLKKQGGGGGKFFPVT